jgi:hypothetical protein
MLDGRQVIGQPPHVARKAQKFIPLKIQRDGPVREMQPAAAAHVKRGLAVLSYV